MEAKSFIKKMFLSLFLVLLPVITINFVVDPGNIYLKKILIELKKSDLVKSFDSSKYGIYFGGNVRLLKLALLENSDEDYDCIGIGSSHIYQIGTVRGKAIKKYCKKFLNLGVSGGGLEDILVFLGALDKNNRSFEKLFVAIDPWTFKFDTDKRYRLFQDYIDYYVKKYELKNYKNSEASASDNTLELRNLINLEYTIVSVKELLKEGFKLETTKGLKFDHIEEENINKLVEKQKVLKDGSLVYPKSHILENRTDKNYSRRPNYKLTQPPIDPKAFSLIQELFSIIRKKHQVGIIMTPYHHTIFRKKFRKEMNQLGHVEKNILRISEAHKIMSFGSFSPVRVGCKHDEFFDFMHPKAGCADKIFLKPNKGLPQ